MAYYERTGTDLLERDRLRMEALQQKLELIDVKLQEIQVMNIMKEVLSRRNQNKVLRELKETIGPDIMNLGSLERIDRLLKTREEIIKGMEILYEEIRSLDIEYTYFASTLISEEREKFLTFTPKDKEDYATSITNQRIQALTQKVDLEDILYVKKKKKK